LCASRLLATINAVSKHSEMKYRRQETLCLPSYCVYAYACETKPPSRGKVLTHKCIRYRPREERPWPKLSDFAMELLLEMRAGRA
jgi:hypothetical protein